MYWLVFWLWLIVGVATLFSPNISKIQYGCVLIPFLVNLFDKAILD